MKPRLNEAEYNFRVYCLQSLAPVVNGKISIVISDAGKRLLLMAEGIKKAHKKL